MENKITHGSIWKNMLLFSLPLMLTNVLQVLFNMSDIAVVGKYVGPKALGAVGSTTIAITLLTGIIMGIGSGVNAIVAGYYGASNRDKVNKTVSSSLFVCLGMGIIIFLLGSFLARPLLELLKTKDDLIDDAAVYLSIYCIGMPALGIYNYGNGVLSALGETKKPLYILLFAGILNVALNLFFVIKLGLSVVGVALASIISQYVSAILILICVFRSEKNFLIKISIKDVKLSQIKEVLALGMPTGFQYAIFAVANLFIQASVNSFDSVLVEGNSAAANADALVYDVMAAFYTAGTTFIGQNFGAGNKKRIIKSYFVSIAYSSIIGLGFGLAIIAAGDKFLSIFTTDPEVINAGMERLKIMSFSYCISAFMDGTVAASRGLGKSVVPTIIVIMGSCMFRIAWIYTVFAYFNTITSLYLLYAFSWSITAAAEIICFSYYYKKQTELLTSGTDSAY